MINLKSVVAAAAVSTIGIASLAAPSASAVAVDSGVTCGGENAIVITNFEKLFVAPENANWTGVTQIGPISVDIPAGTYVVDYVSYDDHSASADKNGVNNEGQTQEQWFAQGLYEGTAVYTSAGTVDLPENVDTISGTFGEVELPAIDAVTLNHVLSVDEDGRFPHSVVPSCLSFTPVVEEVVEEEPKVLGGQGGGEVEQKEEVPTLADTGIGSVGAMTTGVALIAATFASSRTRSTEE